MHKRGLIISVVGIVIILISLLIAVSVVPSNLSGSDNLSISSLFEGVFDKISDEIQIMPGDSTYVSYGTFSSDVPLLWGIQIIDYQSGDKLSIKISNIFGDDYGEFIQDEPILFEVLEISQSDTLNLEIQNIGVKNVTVVVMFSEDPENSEALLNPNSPTMNMIFPLAISGFLIILGILISIIGVIVFLIDWKNPQNNKKNY